MENILSNTKVAGNFEHKRNTLVIFTQAEFNISLPTQQAFIHPI